MPRRVHIPELLEKLHDGETERDRRKGCSCLGLERSLGGEQRPDPCEIVSQRGWFNVNGRAHESTRFQTEPRRKLRGFA